MKYGPHAVLPLWEQIQFFDLTKNIIILLARIFSLLFSYQLQNKTTLNALFKEFFSIFLQRDLNLKYGKEKNFIRISRNITIH